MKAYRECISLTTKAREEIVNITPQVKSIVSASQIQEGLVLVYPQHTSSAVYLSDSDLGLAEDYLKTLEKLIPKDGSYLHDTADAKQNASGHLKAILSGHHITLPLSEGKLDLGAYQTVYYAEFDGKRAKEILVKIIGE